MTARKSPAKSDSSAATEQHYSVQDVMKLWHWSRTRVRETFINEAGVMHSDSPQRKTMSIPQSVLDRVHSRLKAA